jgi:hypothetical protein
MSTRGAFAHQTIRPKQFAHQKFIHQGNDPIASKPVPGSKQDSSTRTTMNNNTDNTRISYSGGEHQPPGYHPTAGHSGTSAAPFLLLCLIPFIVAFFAACVWTSGTCAKKMLRSAFESIDSTTATADVAGKDRAESAPSESTAGLPRTIKKINILFYNYIHIFRFHMRVALR